MKHHHAGDHFEPGYQRLLKSGELAERVQRAYEQLSDCTLCPRSCHVNRLAGERGYCGAGSVLEIASAGPHHGEEPPLSGSQGAGAIFFTHCSLKCCYCQNYQISHQGAGRTASVESLAVIMNQLQARGCANIDLVTPTHYLPFILDAVRLAAENGLTVPLVYNSSGYESMGTMHLLNGIVDIYLPDWKYCDPVLAQQYSGACDYPTVCERAITAMYQQVGDLVENEHRVACHGLIIRHLVLPGHLDNTERILAHIARSFPDSIRLSLMAQYVPCHQSSQHAALQQPLREEEYEQARSMLEACDFIECWIQELESQHLYVPDFTRTDPFVTVM